MHKTKKNRLGAIEMHYIPVSVRSMICCCIGLSCFVTHVSTARADENDALRDEIRALEKRIADLEKLLSHTSPTTESPTPGPSTSVTPESGTASPQSSPNDFRVFWKDSLQMETADKQFKLRLGGRMQNDWAFFDQDESLSNLYGEEEDGTEMRRLRLLTTGTFYENYSFMAQYDFAGGASNVKNMWVAMDNIPWLGQLKVGKFKEPIGLEMLANSNDITFMEFALPSVFYPFHRTGVGISNSAFEQRVAWSAGIFRSTDSFGNKSADGQYELTGRISGLPIYSDNGRKLIHVGLGYSHREIDETVSVRQRPESHLTGNSYLNTGAFDASEMDLLGAEFAWVYGPLSVQGEYTWADFSLDDDQAASLNDDSLHFSGYYGQISYFLTGEHRNYKRGAGVFGPVRPLRNFFSPEDSRGPGAWELAARYSILDLNDGLVMGGEMDNLTLGVNWYLNPNLRVSLNYVMSDIDGPLGDGDLDILQTRFQVTF